MADFGELLRHARAYKGVSLREAERATKINRHHLAALEREEFEDLPPLIYARGLVKNYAQYLGLDPVAVLAQFEEVHGQRSGGFRVVQAVKPLRVPSHWAPNFAIIAFMVIMAAVIFAWVYSAYFPHGSSSNSPAATGSPTVAAAVATPSGTTAVIFPSATPSATKSATTPAATSATGTSATPAKTKTTAASTTPTSTAPTATATTNVSATPTRTGEHTFVVTATNQVWVDVSIDGTSAFSGVLGAGQTKVFSGSTMHVSSGNANYVFVGVDGVSQGLLGTAWNTAKTYP